ncbi:MAG: cupin-like domain-containing protein [Halieaceae bacterium]|nr:cupin-like domain-containing protein [Halieaceae bacterium]
MAKAVCSSNGLVWSNVERVSARGTALQAAIRRRQPVVVTDLAADWPALSLWTPERLSKRYGDRDVRVYDASFGSPGANYMGSIDRMSFAAYLEATQQQGRDLRMFLYNLSRQIPELLDDVRLPDIGLRFSRRFVFSFFGCKGSTTPLHYDIDMGDVLHTVIRGRRRIRLFAPETSVALYRHPCTVRSYVDLDAPDLERFPALVLSQPFEAVLEAGETLYMPSGWWHEFHYLDAGIGVSLRAPSPRWRDRMQGYAKLLLASPLDRLGNRIAPRAWFDWKVRRADQRAARLIDADPLNGRNPGVRSEG